MKDKIALLMRETGCEQGEAELALEMCGYDVEKAVRAISRLFHNIVVIQGKADVPEETLYLLFLVILNLKDRSLLRARAVASYNPAVFSVAFNKDWFGFEKHLYASRLRDGALQSLSQEVEQLLSNLFVSPAAASFYSEAKRAARGKDTQTLQGLLARRFSPHEVRLFLHKDVLDMGQFQELAGRSGSGHARSSSAPRTSGNDAPKTPDSLVLRVALEGSPDGVPAGELSAGDLVYAHINDPRDVARYLAKLFGAQLGESVSLLVPIEAVESGAAREDVRLARGEGGDICVRVRFSLGVCGDVYLPRDIRIKAVRRTEPASWWRKLFGE